MIALYSRVSTAEQAKEGYSIGEQEERLAAYCEARGWKDYKHFTDAGYSGANMNRPALQEVIRLIHQGKVNRIIVYKLDRLSRSQKDTLELLEDLFIPNDIDFISLSESIDTSSAFGKASIGLLSCFSQLEKDTIQQRSSLGREARAKEGKWHGGGKKPIGYDYENGMLRVNEYEAMQIREAHRLYQDGYSFSEIVKMFVEKGYTHKHGEWTIMGLKHVLLNDIYLGTVKFNGEAYRGIHEAIIDEATFDATMSRFQKRYKAHQRSSETYFTGKIFCARCGARYARKTQVMPNGTRHSYYICYSRAKSNKKMIRDAHCKNTNYRCDVFDETIFNELRALTVSEVREYRKESDAQDESRILKREIDKLENQRSRLIDLYSLGKFDAEELTAKIEPLNASIRSIQEQIDTKAEKRCLKDLETAVRQIGGILDQGEPIHIRRLIDMLIDHIEIDGEDITIYWDFD